MKKIVPIINTIIALIALIVTIIMNIFFSKYGYDVLGTTLWIVLECGVILLYGVLIFYDLSYAHYIAIFAALSPIIIGLAYIFMSINNPLYDISMVNIFFIPHIIMYLAMLIIEVLYIRKYVKNKQNIDF